MNFTPKTEEQLRDELLLEEGDYDFEVIEAADTKSKKSGKDMISIKIQVWDKDGATRHVYDYLLEAMMWKLLHFCECVGLQQEFQAGTLRAYDCLKKAGRVSLTVQDAQNGYPAKNIVDDYIVPDTGKKMERPVKTAAAPLKAKKPSPPVETPTEDIDVPF